MFLKTSSLAAVAAVGRKTLKVSGTDPSPGYFQVFYPPGTLPRATDPELNALSLKALDAAKAAGASYADIRFTITHWRTFQLGELPVDREALGVGVRALANGTWGFAAFSDWDPGRVPQLGKTAAEHALATAWSRVPPIQLIDHPPAATGHWVMPVKRDPFTVPLKETTDWMEQLRGAAQRERAQIGVDLTFQRQDRTFASTEGAYTTQTVYTSLGGVPHQNISSSQIAIHVGNRETRKVGVYQLPFITPTGAGYEVLDDHKIPEHLAEWIEKARELSTAKKFELTDEYDVVFDGAAMAAIVDSTFGAALEYDRAVGYEANASGTSYLAPPLQLLGTSRAPSTVTITADRTMPLGAATVQWDDEGVTPRPFPLIENGTLVDYALSREFVAELKPWYQRHGRPVQSNGCAGSESAFTVSMVHPPNLRLEPAAQETGLQALIAGVDNGFLVCGGDVQMDQQQIGGRGRGAQTYAIKRGQLAGPVEKVAYRFQSPAFWKNLVALGGASTAALAGFVSLKGEPDQATVHSVQGVAAHVRQIQVAPKHLA